MSPSCASDADSQIALPFLDIVWNQEIEHFFKHPEEFLRLIVSHDKINNFFMLAIKAFEIIEIIGVW